MRTEMTFLIRLIFSKSDKIIIKIKIVIIKQPLSPKYIFDGFLLKKENIIKNIIEIKLNCFIKSKLDEKYTTKKTINSMEARFKTLPS